MSEPIIRVEDLCFEYNPGTPQAVTALDGIHLEIGAGEYVVIVGHNGSGKSTLARHLNALLLPTRGNVWVNGWNTRDPARRREIRSTVGMVFQNPDNQIVATIVEEDVAFGPENLALPHPEIVRRVDWSLEQVDMQPYRHRAPHLLSGGQKQRVCIAGVLAMRPRVLVLDESTAMLDPLGRQEVQRVARRLNREEGTTVVAITHFMEEAVHADRVVVMEAGRIVLQGTPREVFGQVERLRELHLDVPPITRLAQALHGHDPRFPAQVLTLQEFLDAFQAWRNGRPLRVPPWQPPDSRPVRGPCIRMEGVGHRYMKGTPLEVQAIHGVDLELREGEVLGLIGHTGSGKSTIIQHMNALLRPDQGTVTVFGQDVTAPTTDVRAIRRRVGLVFQQPETQLFERFVGDDVAFGPRNLGLSRSEVRERVRRAMEWVGLGFEAFKDRMTFGLSGGEKRRVALAGVLALQPQVLVLDEPTAGLDPRGRRRFLDLLRELHGRGMTLVLVSHNMEELAEMCHRMYVIAGGTTALEGPPEEVFGQGARLQEMGLDVPPVTQVFERLAGRGLVQGLTGTVYRVEDAVRLLGEAVHAEL